MPRTINTAWHEDPRKLRLLEWLTTPKSERTPPTQELLAAELGISLRLLGVWKAKPDFREAWDREAKAIIGAPERAQEVLDTLYRAATDPNNKAQVAAAKLYLEATNSIRPQQVEVTVKKATELSDDELDALLAQGADAMRRERESAPDAEVIPFRDG